MSRWNGYGARLAALVHITRGQLVTLLLGAVLGVVVSIPAFLVVDALKREAQERAALTGFVEKLQEAEEKMAFHQSRPMVNNPINSVEEARRVGKGLHWGDATSYRRVIMSLIEYVRRSDIDVLQQDDIMELLLLYERGTNPWITSHGVWVQPDSIPGDFAANLDELSELDFLAYRRTRDFDRVAKLLNLCGWLYRFYANEPIEFTVAGEECQVQADQVTYVPAENLLYWENSNDGVTELVGVTAPLPWGVQ